MLVETTYFAGKVNILACGDEQVLTERPLTWWQAWWWRLTHKEDLSLALSEPFDFEAYEGQAQVELFDLLMALSASLTTSWSLTKVSKTRPVYQAEALVKVKTGWLLLGFRYINQVEVVPYAS